jgi:outer membrane protein TolC
VLAVTSAKAQTTLDVAGAFYDAALGERLVHISEEAYAQADRSLNVTQDQRSAGRVSEFELLRARVARDTLEPSVVRARNARAVAYLRLKQLLDLPLAEPLSLISDLDDTALPAPPQFAARVAEAEARLTAQPRVPVALAGNDVKIAEQALAIIRATRLPSIGVRSDLGLVNYPDSFPTLNDWRQNWTVGLALSVPILTGGRIGANAAIARAGIDEAHARLRQTREVAELDDASSRQDLQAARLEWQVSGGTIQQAQRAYEIAELRYSEGLSTQLELADARLQLAQSQVTRAEAARNLQVRRIRFALLPELPFATGVATQSPTATGTQTGVQAAPASAGAPGGR